MLKNTPETIFLQVGGDCPEDADFKDCEGNVTWCADEQHDNDIMYVRADRVPSAQKPVGHVYTVEALVPGGSLKQHAQLYVPLPAGARLYAAAPLTGAPVSLQITGAAQMRLTEKSLASAIEDAARRYADGHPVDFQEVARTIITQATADTQAMAAMPAPQDTQGEPERGSLTWLIGMLRYLASTAVSGKQKVYINDPTFGRVEVGGALYGTGDVELTPNDDEETAGDDQPAARPLAAMTPPAFIGGGGGVAPASDVAYTVSSAEAAGATEFFSGGGGLDPASDVAYAVSSTKAAGAADKG